MSTDTCRWLFLLFFLTRWTSLTNSKEIRVVCYYTNWSVYRPGTAKFSPQNINPYLCTHLVYAFGGFTKENTLKPFDKYQDIEKGGYAKFTGLKTYNKNLKTMLAIGGWNEGSSRFSPMVANPERRKELIKNAVKFLRQNHFDGLDLDWEYPSFRDGGKSRDRDNYAQLVQELREEFERESEKTGRPRLLLTMAVPAGIEYINKGYDVPKLTKYLDWMNILSYDYHSAFEPAVNHHAPLYSLEEPSEYNYDTELNIDYTIKHYLKLGADPNKLVMGIPTYGRSYTLFNPDANEIGAPADGPGDMGEATRENGYLAYYEICEYVKSQDWEVVQPNPDAMGPYAYKGNQWVGYDDDAIARKKAAYVAENGLGGIMFWSIDNDDFRGNCHGRPYPIIEAAKEALISAYGLTDENLVSPPAKPIKAKTRTRPSSKPSTEVKTTTASSLRRRNRVKSKSSDSSSNSRPKPRRKESRRTTEATVYSSLELVTPSYTTPAPPATPDQGGGFKCEDEGFYPHPKDCKKYYWCLSGPGELGIIAHQFTCPAGLYFNKAADSCDYTRNVLCNKKLSKATTTTTTSTEASTSKSTTRAPPRITAATSRTTVFRTSTTTTEAYDEEDYEYEDEEEDVEDSKNAEEDPKVIKELLDLIKKAGGIEQLEKQLKIHEDGSASVSHPDATTPSSISKSLVERVLLAKAAKNSGGKRTSYSFLNRNSRGPQNEGISKSEEKEKSRPQYTTITRQRAQKATDEDVDEDEDKKDDGETSTKYSKKQPEYVNIRRARVSTTTEEPEEDSKSQINRNKILGEEDEEETDEEEEDKPSRRRLTTPQYVNIRRQRPSTTEETSTSKYTVIRRGSTTEADVDEEDDSNTKQRGTTPAPEDTLSDGKKRGTTTPSTESKPKYKILRRGSTTESSIEGTEAPNNEDDSSQLKSRRRGTTLPTTPSSSDGKTRGTTLSSVPETSSLTTEDTDIKSKYKGIKRGSTTESTATSKDESTDESTTKSSSTSQTSSAQTSVESTPEIDNPTTSIDQLLITTPDSLSVKTASSLSSNGSKLSDSESQTPSSEKRTPLLLEPRPFSLSTGAPSSSIKPVTESSTRVTKVSESNYKRVRPKVSNTQSDTLSTTEKPSPFRTRAPSRFKPLTTSSPEPQTSRAPTNRARKRFSTTTESSYENYEEPSRTYRPLEIADLSSLTAVDFEAVKGLRFGGSSRQRRPRPTSSTTTTTKKPEEGPKTGSRTSPLARKYLEGSTFGKNRRVKPSQNEPVLEDQINSSSDTTHKIREFTRAPSRFTTAAPSTEPTRYAPRSRKIIRRLRPVSRQTDNEDSLKKLINRPTPSGDKENLIESASSNPLLNRRFSRPTPQHSTESSYKLSSTSEISKATTPEDDEQNETSDDVSTEEGENIKLSESNIRENSNVNNNNVLNSDDGKKGRRKILKRIRSKVEEKDDDDLIITTEKSSTEPSVIIRTKKIIRKIKPTESTPTISSVEPVTQGRKRKIIRRLRPTTASSKIEDSEHTEKSLYLRGRPIVNHFNTEKPFETKPEKEASFVKKYQTLSRISPTKSTLQEEKDEVDESEQTTLKSKYTTIQRNATPQHSTTEAVGDTDNEDSEKYFKNSSTEINRQTSTESTTTKAPENVIRGINRSIYSTINRGTTSTTSTYESDLESTKNSDDEDEDEDGQNENNDEGTRKYRIHQPTISKNYDNENVTPKSTKYRILRPQLSEIDDSTNDDSKTVRILRPSNESEPEEIKYENPLENTTLTPNSDLSKNNSNFAEVSDNNNEQKSESENAEPILTTEHYHLDEHYETENDTQENNKTENIISPTENSENNTNNTEEASKNEQEFDITTIARVEDENSGNSTEVAEEIPTTTVKFVNPILERQKNRPTFRPPRLTTPNPSRTTSSSKPRYRVRSRFTAKTPTSSTTEKSEENKNEEPERKFVPKSFGRARYSTIGRQNRTEATITIESSTPTTSEVSSHSTETSHHTTTIENVDEVDITTTSNEEKLTTEKIDLTTLVYLSSTEQDNTNVTEETDLNEEKSTVAQPSNDTTLKLEENTSTTSTTSVTEKTTALFTSSSSTDEAQYLLNDTSPDYVSIYNETETLNDTQTEDPTTYKETEVPESTTLTNPSSTINDIETTLNETSVTYIETSTINVENTTTETTPTVHVKSSLRPIQNRPKYNVPKRIKLTQNENVGLNGKPSSRFRGRGRTTTTKLLTPSLRSTTPLSPVRSRFNYKYSTTERAAFITTNNEEEPEFENEDDKIDENEENLEEEIEEKILTPRTPSSYTPRNQLSAKSKSRISNRPAGYNFKKTTEAPKVTEDLSGIDKEAVKNRNKNLFSKKRKMNVPFSGSAENEENEEKSTTTEAVTEGLMLTTTPLISESVTKPTTEEFQTTESLTTLHHVFAETEQLKDTPETTTASILENSTSARRSKVEKLIEVNRIVEVHEKNTTNTQPENKVIDKIGVINRVTEVKVVDGESDPEENEINDTTSASTTVTTLTEPKSEVTLNIKGAFIIPEIALVSEIPNSQFNNPTFDSSDRQDRKYEIYSNSKVADFSEKGGHAEIIDGRSQINIITPRPHYSTEASTISLEGLFQTDTPQKLKVKPLTDEEILETGHSRYVNIRVLGQDSEKERKIKDRSPLNVLYPDDYITMKAEVVEVTPKISQETIKIVPIKVEMTKKIIGLSDFKTRVEGGVPKVNYKIIGSDNE